MTGKAKIAYAAVGFVTLFIVIFALDGLMGLALIMGLLMAIVVLMRPTLGLVLLIFSGTCFQIIGSSHLTGLPLSMAKILGVLTLGSWMLDVLREHKPLTYSPQMIPLAVFAGVFLLSAFIMPDRARSMTGLFKFLQVYLFYFLIANRAGESKKTFLVIAAAYTIGTSISGLIGVLEYFLPGMAIESDDPRIAEGTLGAVMDRDSVSSANIKRITGGLADANWLAYTLATALPLNAFWWYHFSKPSARLAVIGATVLQGAGLILSYTRTGLLGLGMAVLYLVWKKRLPLAPIAGLAMVMTVVFLFWMPAGYAERMFSKKYLEQGSTPLRRDLFYAATQLISERPILGFGYGRYGFEFMKRLTLDPKLNIGEWGEAVEAEVEAGREQVHNIGAHSLYLEVAVEYGFLGLIPFVMFLIFAIRDLRQVEIRGSPMESDLAVCITAGLIAFYVCGLLGHAKILKSLWIMTAFAAALRRIVLTRLAGERQAGATAEQPQRDGTEEVVRR